MDDFDVIVIGGGAAGLSAGLMLARARVPVLVVDAGAPRNAPAGEVHGLFGRDGTPPADLLARGRDEVRRYGGRIVSGTVTDAHPDGDDFAVTVDGDRRFTARRIVVATGLVDDVPDLPGLRERWGAEVVHCPFCHGWEVRDTAIGVLALNPRAMHQALLFHQWSPDVTLFVNGQPGLAEEAAERGIPVVEGVAEAVELRDGRVAGIRLVNGDVHPVETVVIGPRSRIVAPFLQGLGLAPVEHPSGIGEYLPTDAQGRTGVPGVWAAGNVTDPSAQVGGAAAAAALVAGQLAMEFALEKVARLRTPTGAPE
ncbi:NAD(P)/FAD-dependent oxidoreductase [Leifsonia shinshuensis]|uniref:NAD(P)/FAD-dependent oxidoreductase n=1 Tax=Leifsonia shinshuensis TaxID=150026 RepID=UPI001F512825|nr:NAD(P)/FAD-dependent oxidoreductase [Leifsonia shinshuensis]MCI0159203.1 NAD(P)/FAD-dependent oxidoreductase [Leifsonia shinshuensis]